MSIKKNHVINTIQNDDGTYLVFARKLKHISIWGRCKLNNNGDYNPFPLCKHEEERYIFGVHLFHGNSFRSLKEMMDTLKVFLSGKKIERRILLISIEKDDLSEEHLIEYEKRDRYE